ncbi:hypothetical protein SLS62_006494 [Diatrype stigma]|uniref:Transcription factor domain-containing protein n=1 Tax=Diatrype stigma TaxID=117547 RepID=A0AAN9UYF5_9PEZI
MNYTRKRKCNPCLRLLQESNADCLYQELSANRVEDSSPSAVVDRLARIESMLEQQSQQLGLLSVSSPRVASTSGDQPDYFSGLPQQSDYLQSTTAIGATEVDSTQFLIPKDHATIASALLALPRARRLLGDYPRDFFFQLEETLPLPGILSNVHDATQVWPSLEPDVLDTLAMKYFQHVHPHQPLFTHQSFRLWQDRLLQAQVMDEITTAICFCVYALGTICTLPEDAKADETLGLEYFQPALRTILHHAIWGYRPNIAICQALLLAASDRVAELDVQRSGIEPLGDKMPLPHSTGPSDDENTICSIAEHAIRRLLNRIHFSLYGPVLPMSMSRPEDPTKIWQGLGLQKLQTLSSELNRQLEEWYNSIPEPLRPSKGTAALPNDRLRVLRIRYYAARHIIHRPYVLQTVSRQRESASPRSSPMGPSDHQYGEPTPAIMEMCEVCVDSCLNYLYNAVEMIDKRSPYLWSFSQSCMACLVLLWMADSCVALRHLVPNMHPIQSAVLARLRKWATKGSSFDAEARIIERLVFSDPMLTS